MVLDGWIDQISVFSQSLAKSEYFIPPHFIPLERSAVHHSLFSILTNLSPRFRRWILLKIVYLTLEQTLSALLKSKQFEKTCIGFFEIHSSCLFHLFARGSSFIQNIGNLSIPLYAIHFKKFFFPSTWNIDIRGLIISNCLNNTDSWGKLCCKLICY